MRSNWGDAYVHALSSFYIGYGPGFIGGLIGGLVFVSFYIWKNNLNWNPTISFNEGVQEMLAKIDNWKDAPLWDVNSIDEAKKIGIKKRSSRKSNIGKCSV